jgi:hypothetical protein
MMLRSVEDLFSLGHIGYAQLPGERSFGTDIFTCGPRHAGDQVESVHLVGRGRYRKLAIHTVAAPTLRVSVSAAHQRTRKFSRTLAPCRTYVYQLPHFTHARVGLAAAPVSGHTQRATLHY